MPSRQRQVDAPYSEKQTRAWLSWLARGMRQHGQTVFLIEQLQPSWLRGRWERLVYALGSRIAVSLILGLAYGILFAFSRGWEALPFGLTAGGIGGFCAGLIELRRLPRKGGWRWLEGRGVFAQAAVSTFVFGLAGLLGSVFSHYVHQPANMYWGFATVFGAYWGLRAHRRMLTTDVYTSEILSWSWLHAGKSALVAAAPCLALLVLIFIRLDSDDIAAAPVPGRDWTVQEWRIFLAGLVFLLTLVAVLFGGLRDRTQEMSAVPNQGIRLSFRNGFLAAIAGPVIALIELVFFIAVALVRGDPVDEVKSVWLLLLLGSAVGLIALMRYGVLAVVQHYLLRIILSCRRRMPWRFARFLDHAAEELRFLQKVGGGYMFVHRYLLEHFAAEADSDLSGEVSRQLPKPS